MRATMLVLLLSCTSASASDWLSLGKGNKSRSEQFVDVSSIRIANAVRRVWSKTVLAQGFQKGTGRHSHTWRSSFVSRDAYNCTEETHRTEALTVYFTDETFEPQPTENYPTAWIPVQPDTIESVEMAFVCAWELK
jgi:hypothetical protein